MGTTALVAQVAHWVQDGPLADRESRAHAFRLHVEPEIEVLLRVARTLTRSGADAEDLVQETLVRAYRAIDRFDGRHPRAWLLTILRNTNANMHRRRRPGLVDDWVVMDDQRPPSGSRRRRPRTRRCGEGWKPTCSAPSSSWIPGSSRCCC